MSDSRRLADLDGIQTGRKLLDEIEISTRGEVNRNLARRWFREVWNERCAETIDELFRSDAIGHTENGDQGPAEFKAARLGLLDAFPDIQVEVEDTAADGDHVVVRWRARGTWLAFKNGVIVEGWDSWNLGRLLESLTSKLSNAGFQMS